MQMLIKKLSITTTLDGFDPESCYRVLGVEFINKSPHFLVVDDNEKFRILDDKECLFFSFFTDEEFDENCEECDGNCEECDNAEK